MVYRTKKHGDLDKELEQSLKNSTVDRTVMVFFSPSGVEFSSEVVKHLSDHSKLKFVALGPSSEKALRRLNLEVNGVCQKPNPYSLLQVIKAIDNKW